jgi:hypothetical protein
MNNFSKFIFGKAKLPRKRKRRLLVFTAAMVMLLSTILHMVFKLDLEYGLLIGFGIYTMSEMYDL